MPVNNLNEILSNELSNAQEKDKWLIKLLYNLHNINRKAIIWCNCGICSGTMANFLGVAIAKELNQEINIKEDNNKFEGLPYNLNTLPLDTSLLDLDPRFSEKAIDYVEDSFLSLSEEIRESCKIYLRNIEWSINHYKSSRK